MAIKLSDFEKATYQARGKTIEVPNLYQSIKEDKLSGRIKNDISMNTM